MKKYSDSQKATLVQYQKKSPFCGFPEYPMNTTKYTLTMQTKSRLFVLNSYRKLMMGVLGVKKLKVQSFQTDDKFLIQEHIESRIQQLPLNLTKCTHTQFKLSVTNKIQEPLIVYSDHIFVEYEGKRLSITRDLQVSDTYNLFKLQEGCSINIVFNLIEQLPESDDKFRGCFVSVYEDESIIKEEDEYNYVSERAQSTVRVQTYGSLYLDKLKSFFCTHYLSNLFKDNVFIRVDKDQNNIIFKNTPLYIVDAILCINKSYFFSHFKSVVPTTTDDYQSSLILIPRDDQKYPLQTKDDLNIQINESTKQLVLLMNEFEQEIVDILTFLYK